MRITQRSVALDSLRGLNNNLSTVNRYQQQMTAGKTISKPSDSPTGTNTSMLIRHDISSAQQHERNITDGRTVLDSTDSALQDMMAQVRRVRDLTVQALNSGGNDATSLLAIKTEVAGVRESLLGKANEVVQGRPLFGGVSSGKLAYDANGAYVGLGGAGGVPIVPVTRRVSDVEAIRVDVTGPEVFGDPASGKDLFAVVALIAQDVGNPAALQAHLGDLDAAFSGMLKSAADIGTRSARMDGAAQTNSAHQLNLHAQLSSTEDVDLPKTIMELHMQQVGYEASLSATSKAIQPTLLDYLR